MGVANENCGGAERFFADFFDIYNSQKKPKNKLFFFTDKVSFNILNKKLGKLKYFEQIIFLKTYNNRFKFFLERLNFIVNLFKCKIDVIHISSYKDSYYNIIKKADSLRFGLRPKIVLNIVDAGLAHVFDEPSHPQRMALTKKYGPLFTNIHIDGIYS